MEHNVIIGASAAGVSAAISMRSNGFAGRVTLIDRDPRTPYERPPLSKLTDRILRPIVPLDRFEELDIDLRLGSEVRSVVTAARTLQFGPHGSERVDAILLSTGVGARRLDVPGADLDHIHVLRDASDAEFIAERFAIGGPLAVVGAGFIGLEIAALARDHGVDVTVIELAQRPLNTLDPTVGSLALELHEDRGVRFALGRTVHRFEGSGVVEDVMLDNGTRIPAATVVVGVGVEPRLELAHAAGVRTDRHGIAVDAYGRTSVPWIFAAGDVASQPHPHLPGGPARIEHWDVAMKHGAAVGATMAGHPTAFTEMPYVWSDQFGLTFQMFGRPLLTDELLMQRGSTSTSYLCFWIRDGNIVAVCGLDRPREIGAARRLVGLPVARFREALIDDGADLRALVKAFAQN